ncbi:MAG: hypothetical protein JWP44_4934, partial [Mucilaginibacter sp.]|nr:hypothetical protein [Mucilaginibacter sp.]
MPNPNDHNRNVNSFAELTVKELRQRLVHNEDSCPTYYDGKCWCYDGIIDEVARLRIIEQLAKSVVHS